MSFVAPSSNGPAPGGAAIRRQPQIPCGGCSKEIDHRSLYGRCESCNLRPCDGCGKAIKPRNKGGLCANCHTRHQNADPAFQERRVAGIRRKFEDPEYLAKIQRIARRMGQKAGLDPELRKRRVAFGKWLYVNVLMRPDVVAKRKEALKTIGPRMSRAKLPWCPPELRERYIKLQRNRKLSVSAAKEIVLAEWDELRAIRHPCYSNVVHFMRRVTSVSLLDSGNYRVGLVDLTPGELLKRAEARGYQERLAA